METRGLKLGVINCGMLIAALLPLFAILHEFWYHHHPLVLIGLGVSYVCLVILSWQQYRQAMDNRSDLVDQTAATLSLAIAILFNLFLLRLFYVLLFGQKLLFTNELYIHGILPNAPESTKDVAFYALGLGLFFVALLIIRRVHQVKLDFFLRFRFKLEDICFIMLVGAITWLALHLYMNGYQQIHAPMQVFGTDKDSNSVVYWIAGICFALANALKEEFWHRGLILGSLTKIMRPNTAILISALVFGLIHWFGTPKGILGFVLAGSWGLMLAWWTIRRKSLWPTLIVHFLADILIFVYTN